MRDAERDDICGYCHKNIWVHLGHQIGTSPFYIRKPSDPGESGKWIHSWCVEELRDIELAKEAEEALQEPEPEPVALQQFDEPAIASEPRAVRIEEAASRAGLSVTTMRRVLREGYARGFKDGGRTYVYLPEQV